MMRPATIFLGQRRRDDGLARAEGGAGEGSARASAFFFGEIHIGELVSTITDTNNIGVSGYGRFSNVRNESFGFCFFCSQCYTSINH